ncbi:hypothetical protein FOZ62_015953, partial [Perkinsus olseni]
GRSKGTVRYVQPDMLPAGTYKAVEHYGGGVCPELPDLLDFEMERTAALAGQPPTSSKEPFKLAVYGRGTLKSLKRLGSLEIRKPPKCFHIEPRSEASGFVSKFYTSLSLVVPSFLYAQLIFCQTELGLIVGIGPNRDSHGSWISSDYGFKLELQSANVREIAALPKDSLEGPPRAG